MLQLTPKFRYAQLLTLATTCFTIGLVVCSAKAEGPSLREVANSYASLIERVETWSGDLEVRQEVDGNKESYSGSFVWQSKPYAGYCRLEYPTTFRVKPETGDHVKSFEGVRKREVVVVGEKHIAAWMNIPMTEVPGFEKLALPGGSNRRRPAPFALGTIEPLDKSLLITPNQNFFPDFMFRGNSPSFTDFLIWISDQDGLIAIKASDSLVEFQVPLEEVEFQFALTKGIWLPRYYKGKSSGLKWEWQAVEGCMLPVKLELSEPALNHSYSYRVTNSRVNEAVDASLFSENAMGFSKGDRLADHIEKELYVHDGKKFVRADLLLPQVNWNPVQVVGLVFIILAVVAIIFRKKLVR
jgi:hypothetical protein